MRATHYLLQGDIPASFRHHPFLIPLLIILLFLYAKCFYEFRFQTTLFFRGELPCFIIVFVAILLFFVIRNIPLESLEWTRPPNRLQVSRF